MQENQSQASERVNLLNFDVEGIKAWCAELGEKPYRASLPAGCIGTARTTLMQ